MNLIQQWPPAGQTGIDCNNVAMFRIASFTYLYRSLHFYSQKSLVHIVAILLPLYFQLSVSALFQIFFPATTSKYFLASNTKFSLEHFIMGTPYF